MHPKCRACARAPRVDRGAGIALARKSYLPPPFLRAFSLLARLKSTVWGLKVSQRPGMFGKWPADPARKEPESFMWVILQDADFAPSKDHHLAWRLTAEELQKRAEAA